MAVNTTEIQILRRAALTYRAINHKKRIEIFNFLLENEMKVTDIYVHFRLEQSVASQQLAILRKVGLVTARREGKEIYYTANGEKMKSVIALSEQLIKTQS